MWSNLYLLWTFVLFLRIIIWLLHTRNMNSFSEMSSYCSRQVYTDQAFRHQTGQYAWWYDSLWPPVTVHLTHLYSQCTQSSGRGPGVTRGEEGRRVRGPASAPGIGGRRHSEAEAAMREEHPRSYLWDRNILGFNMWDRSILGLNLWERKTLVSMRV